MTSPTACCIRMHTYSIPFIHHGWHPSKIIAQCSIQASVSGASILWNFEWALIRRDDLLCSRWNFKCHSSHTHTHTHTHRTTTHIRTHSDQMCSYLCRFQFLKTNIVNVIQPCKKKKTPDTNKLPTRSVWKINSIVLFRHKLSVMAAKHTLNDPYTIRT